MIKNIVKNLFFKVTSALNTAKDYTDTKCNEVLSPNVLLAERTVASGTTYTLSDSIENYRYLLVGVSNGSEWKYYMALPNKEHLDVSWNATNSVSWYIIMALQFPSSTSINVYKLTLGGFTTAKLKIYGLK